tara:strand:+ start:29072 stop:29290 length:219 start_codon:yes stop_codon:yes gene_type:complete
LNAKKCKELRKAALVLAVQDNLPYVDYEFKTYQKQWMDLTGRAFSYVVYTAKLKDSQRKIYQDMKTEFKQSA